MFLALEQMAKAVLGEGARENRTSARWEPARCIQSAFDLLTVMAVF